MIFPKSIVLKRKLINNVALVLLSVMMLSSCTEKVNTDGLQNDTIVSKDVLEQTALEASQEDYSEQIDPDMPTEEEPYQIPPEVLNGEYGYQIIEGTTWYTLEGRSSIYPLALGEHHEHPGCDTTDEELMALGQEKLEAAKTIDALIVGVGIKIDPTKVLQVEGRDEGYDALHEDIGTYDSIMELYKKHSHRIQNCIRDIIP